MALQNSGNENGVWNEIWNNKMRAEEIGIKDKEMLIDV